jgi:hypothetical protein
MLFHLFKIRVNTVLLPTHPGGFLTAVLQAYAVLITPILAACPKILCSLLCSQYLAKLTNYEHPSTNMQFSSLICNSLFSYAHDSEVSHILFLQDKVLHPYKTMGSITVIMPYLTQ